MALWTICPASLHRSWASIHSWNAIRYSLVRRQRCTHAITFKDLHTPRGARFLWIAADYLQIPALQNMLVDEMEQIRLDWYIHGPFRCIETVSKRLPHGAAMRSLVFEQCRRFAPSAWYTTLSPDHEKLPTQYLFDYVVADRMDKEHWGPSQPDPFSDRAEFIRRFHVPGGA